MEESFDLVALAVHGLVVLPWFQAITLGRKEAPTRNSDQHRDVLGKPRWRKWRRRPVLFLPHERIGWTKEAAKKAGELAKDVVTAGYSPQRLHLDDGSSL